MRTLLLSLTLLAFAGPECNADPGWLNPKKDPLKPYGNRKTSPTQHRMSPAELVPYMPIIEKSMRGFCQAKVQSDVSVGQVMDYQGYYQGRSVKLVAMFPLRKNGKDFHSVVTMVYDASTRQLIMSDCQFFHADIAAKKQESLFKNHQEDEERKARVQSISSDYREALKVQAEQHMRQHAADSDREYARQREEYQRRQVFNKAF